MLRQCDPRQASTHRRSRGKKIRRPHQNGQQPPPPPSLPLETQAPLSLSFPFFAPPCSPGFRLPTSLRDGKPPPRFPCPGIPISASRPSVSRLVSVRARVRLGVPVAVVVEWSDAPDLGGFKLNRGCARAVSRFSLWWEFWSEHDRCPVLRVWSRTT
jgi:hypothetical protein